MKKLLARVLAGAMMLSLVACGGTEGEGEGETPEATYKTGLGMDVSATLADATADKDGSMQIDTTIAVVTFDGEGKVVAAKLDVAQQKATIGADGTVKDLDKVDTRTKVEKKEDYGMKGVSAANGIGKELYEQLAAFEEWMVGKTVEEIVGTETVQKDEEHTDVPADPDLAAGVTISIGSYLNAIQKAWDNAEETAGVPAKTGLGVVTTLSGADYDATAEKDGQVQINTNVVGASFDADGKVVAATIDVAQQTGKFDATGAFTTEPDLRTKVEKKEDYGMKGISKIGKEVYEQYDALGEWMEGKTAEEIKAMPTTQRDEEHTAVPDVEELKASVTITVADYLTALEKARA